VFTGGLRIATTVDLEAQAAAERAVAAVAGRRGGGPYGSLVAVEPGSGRSGRWSAGATGGATPASDG
jgi:membrane peptidoglycan carboxypeptidase